MDLSRFIQDDACRWRLPPFGAMRVPAIIFADAELAGAMDDKVFQQIVNVAALPGIVEAAFAMPDAHWGYGFPIGGVAAFDPDEGGVISAGGVGFDISCGVRLLTTGLKRADLEPHQRALADALYVSIPAGLGSKGQLDLSPLEMDAMLGGGAKWAVDQGYGTAGDLDRIEEQGMAAGAAPSAVSERARARQRKEMGTLGSGNHYLEVQAVDETFDHVTAGAYGLAKDDLVVSIHCGSRGLGHQIGTEYLREMALAAPGFGIELADLELACAPLGSALGQRYLGAMRAAINCALANRQIITHLVRRAVASVFPDADLRVLFDVSHNTCKEEVHRVEGARRRLFVHRKGATRAYGPGHPDLPPALRAVGQPVFVGGSMGTNSYVMAGRGDEPAHAFGSACHGAGRSLSRHQALKQWGGRAVVDALAEQGIMVRSHSMRGVAEEAPGAYKDVTAVVDAAHASGLAHKVAKLSPVICIKG
jgi:tRNA-splicing ligase RtcB (3'-phosphate/5'-hydroxy nucleic acid ligase)